MAYENIYFKYDHMTGEDGYFYMFDHAVSNLIVKTDDGSIAFTYPLDTDISAHGEVQAVEFDGFNFWTLQNPAGSIVIRQWQIENYVVIQQAGSPYIKTNDASYTWDAYAMTVEHYHLEFSSQELASPPQSVISVQDSEGIITGSIDDYASSPMLIYLGPSTHSSNEGVTEAHTVQAASNTTITLNSNLTYNYEAGDPVTLISYVWVINNYYETDTEGGLYRFYSNGLGISGKWSGNEYDNIYACTFSSIPAGTFVDPAGAVHALSYVRGSNMLIKQIGDTSDPNYLNNYGSMAMDNVNDAGTSIYTVFDMFIYNLNVYRLQQYATYYGSDQNWGSNRHYQLATLEPFVHSISLQASPAVIPADNGTSTSTITAVVKSQFLEPIVGRTVTFTDDDGVGDVSPDTDPTDSDGVATTIYYSGTTAREVTITATAVQT